MTDILKTSSDNIGIEAREAQQVVDGPSTSSRQNAVNRLTRHLSRTITQPRGLYESIIDAYGPISEPDVLQAEASQVEEAYRSLHASCSSDTETCSSHEDFQEIHPDSTQDRKDGTDTRGEKDQSGQRSRSRRKHDSQKRGDTQKRSDEEWAKSDILRRSVTWRLIFSILTRRTGYGCLQRNQVSKYITQLESSVGELQVEVSSLSPQVILLDQHRWILQEENDTLKHKIAELSRYQLFKEDQNSALQKELQSLRIQQADHLEQAERKQQDTVPNSKEGPHTARGDDAVAKSDLSVIQQQGFQSIPAVKHTTKKEVEGVQPHLPKESSRSEQEKTTSLRSSPSSQKEPPAEGKVSRLSLVKWPSTLYRSVSAIRKDVLEVAIEESTLK
ncbi:unnamed protein product [Calypogeia fissa]